MTGKEWEKVLAEWRSAPAGTWPAAMLEALTMRRAQGGAWEVRAKRWMGGRWMFYACRVGDQRWAHLKAWRISRELDEAQKAGAR